MLISLLTAKAVAHSTTPTGSHSPGSSFQSTAPIVSFQDTLSGFPELPHSGPERCHGALSYCPQPLTRHLCLWL